MSCRKRAAMVAGTVSLVAGSAAMAELYQFSYQINGPLGDYEVTEWFISHTSNVSIDDEGTYGYQEETASLDLSIGDEVITVSAGVAGNWVIGNEFGAEFEIPDVPGFGPMYIVMFGPVAIKETDTFYGDLNVTFGPGQPFGEATETTGTWSATPVPTPKSTPRLH